MPIDLQIIRANEFVCLDTDELLDFEASRQLLQGLAFACRKRGLERAMIDLRALPVPVRPHFTLAQIAALVGTFREAGFTRKQRLAILYSHDVHRGIRNFAFFSKMRGLQVQPFLDFETAVHWLSEGMEDSTETQPGTPIQITKRETKKKTLVGRPSARCADATTSERKTGLKTKYRLAGLILLVATAIALHAQTAAPSPGAAASPPSAPAPPSEADLEKLVAPIALYPDPLISILLPASAYPLEIVQAARFIQNTNNISKVDSQNWDANVKSLCHFPDALNKMNNDLDWTSSLGQAFVQDQKGVLNAIQVMRAKAQSAGTLKTTPQQVVVVTNTIIQIEPAQPQVIYVPEYNPAVVYVGPTPGEVAAASVISFGVGMAVGAIIANNCDWHSGGIYVGPHGGVVWGGGYHGDVNIHNDVNINVNNNNFHQNNNFNHNGNNNLGGQQKWQPDANRTTATRNTSPDSRGWSNSSSESRVGGSQSAFSNYGGASQTRAASRRGASSRRVGGGGGGGFHGHR